MAPSSELPTDSRGRLYHIRVAPGELAPVVLTCGDPARARKIIARLESVSLVRRNREFLTATGTYRKNIPVSVMATGIGPDNTAIAVIEAAQCARGITFIRLGSCGAIDERVRLGDLVISSAALRLDAVSDLYTPGERIVKPDRRVLAALKRAVSELGYPHHVGLTATTCDFYCGQGRCVPGFPSKGAIERFEMLKGCGALNLEMEMAAYFALARASTLNLKAGGVCAVYADRTRRSFGRASERHAAEARCIDVGLRAVEILAEGGMFG
jgi:uridine phosphorylase